MALANRLALLAVVGSEFFLRQSLWDFRREHRQILHAIFFLALLLVSFQKKLKIAGDPWSGVFSVLCAKAVFLFVPFTLEILISILSTSFSVSWALLTAILRLFDATPLWLLAAAGPPVFSALAHGTRIYLRWWLWGALWAVGAFAVGVVAVLSALLGLKVS